DVPPTGVGLNTLTCAVPTAAMSAAPMDACSCVALTYVVGLSTLFQRTTEPAMNLLPVTVNVNPVPPTTTDCGDSAERIGIGLTDGSTVTGGLADTRALLTKRRNSYWPAVFGVGTVHVRSMTPGPTSSA